MEQKLKLTIELVPQTGFKSLRRIVGRSAWNKIRKETYAKYNHGCGICDRKGRINCHTIWEYDDQNHVQRLTGFITLCSRCRQVKDIELARTLADEGKLDYEDVVEHFMKVNDCDRKTFEQHRAEALGQRHERSQHKWTIELGEYEGLAKQN